MENVAEVDHRHHYTAEQEARYRIAAISEKMRHRGGLQRQVIEGLEYYQTNLESTGFAGVHIGSLTSQNLETARLATVTPTSDGRWCVIYDLQSLRITDNNELIVSLAEEFSHMSDMAAIFQHEGRTRAMTHDEVVESEIQARTFAIGVYEELRKQGYRNSYLEQPLAEIQRIRLQRAVRMLSSDAAERKIRETVAKHLTQVGYDI